MSAHDLADWAFFLVSFGLPFTLYLVAQVIALLRLRGHARAWAALAMPFMAWVVWLTADAYRQQSNLWPIALIFLSPLALAYLGLVVLVARARARGQGVRAGDGRDSAA